MNNKINRRGGIWISRGLVTGQQFALFEQWTFTQNRSFSQGENTKENRFAQALKDEKPKRFEK